MLKRDWSRFATAGGLVLGTGAILWLTVVGFDIAASDKAAREIERGNASAHSYDANQPTECVNLTIPKDLANCVRNQAAAQHQKQHIEADLHAQADMASYARGLLWFSALSFIAGAGGLVALIWTFNEQRKLTVAGDRARVLLKPMNVGLSYVIKDGKNDLAGFTITVIWHNFGKTPAKICSAAHALEWRNPGEPIPEFKSEPEKAETIPAALPPGSDYAHKPWPFDKQGFENFKAGKGDLYLYGRVEYLTEFGPDRKVTEFCMLVEYVRLGEVNGELRLETTSRPVGQQNNST